MNKNYVYLIRSDEGMYKIGISRNPNKRIAQLQTGNSSPLKLISIFESQNASKIERTLHRRFNYCKVNREWFGLSIFDEYNFNDYCKVIEESINKLKELNNIFI